MSIRTRSESLDDRSHRIASRTKLAVAVPLFLVLSVLAPHARADSDELAEYRERFKTGLEKYKAGQVAEALHYWEPIYRELGATRGYRLAFNLAHAYDGFGDFTRASERYESFVSEVETRRAAKEKIEPLIEKEVKESRARLSELAASKGRIRVTPGERPIAVRIDAAEPRVSGFLAYVNPGVHSVVLGAGSDGSERREVTVKAGELVEVVAVPPPPPPPDASGTAPPTVPNNTTSKPPQQTFRMESRVEHPFSPAVLYVATGLTLASVALPILTYSSALSYQRSHKLSGDTDPGSQARNASLQSDYDARSTTYNVTLAVPIALAAITLGLTVYYLGATQEREVPVPVPPLVPVLSPTKDGAVVGFARRF